MLRNSAINRRELHVAAALAREPRALPRRAPETHGANQSPPLMPAEAKDAEQPTCDRRGLRNRGASQLDVVDDSLEVIAH